MTDVAKDSPRGTASTINRKPHTKSRTGCYSCKARRVKSLLPPPPSIKPASAPPQFPPFFTIDDMRFFHHYMVSAYPYLPQGSDAMWITEIPLLAHQHEFLMHAILSLGASHLSLVAADVLGPEEMRGYAAMLSHRGLALRGLQQSMDNQALADPSTDLTTSPTTPNIPELNAMLATCYALTIQSGHLCDGFTDFLVLIRGCGRLTGHIAAVGGLDPFSLHLIMETRSDLRSPLPHLVGGIDERECSDDDNDEAADMGVDMGAVKRDADVLRSLIPLLHHESHRSYHATLLDAAEGLQRRAWIDACNAFQKAYTVLCSIDDASFQNHIISPTAPGVMAEMEKNAMFLVMFIHFTALQVVMYPILWRMMPERARLPQLLMPQTRWLIEISGRIPPELRGYLAVPLDIVVKVGERYGVFNSVLGQRVKEGLITRTQELG
ncbi:C6 transcription factor [Histoplasma capsulatum var. duboisii H88]|uniref:C6 transcription factor n=1 Tax=Ajellomyces capsulatus (strain H88) TaxID=544711 RepID=F0UMQ9_AJEC8|nr:C6 transcription factor [Histoplasma capsulatum var. duboisii H88]